MEEETINLAGSGLGVYTRPEILEMACRLYDTGGELVLVEMVGVYSGASNLSSTLRAGEKLHAYVLYSKHSYTHVMVALCTRLDGTGLWFIDE